MKKYNLYLWLIALIGLFAACSQDDTADALPADTTDANRVTLTASLPADFVQPQPKSRALPVNPEADTYKLRCILEIWDTEAVPALRVRQEIVPEAGDTEINFAFQLANTGTYKALLWADYIFKGNTSPSITEIAGLSGVNHYYDGHYTTTNGLKEVQQPSSMQPNLSDGWDAFYASSEFTKGETALALPTVTLTRPFTRVTIAEKNAARFDACKQVTAKFKMPAQFDVATGTVSGEKDYALISEISTTAGPVLNFGTDVTIGGQTCKTLFCVYLFAGATDGTMGDIKLEFTATEEGKSLPTVTIPAGIPVKRNHRINAAGNLIGEPSSDAVTMTVDINSEWTNPDEEKDIDPAPKVGDYFYQDGTWGTAYINNASNPCIGIVFEVNADGESGKIVSLDETTAAWATDGTTYATTKTNANNLADGTANMAIIKNLDDDYSDFPAFQWCANRTKGGLAWYLPAPYELQDLYAATCGLKIVDANPQDGEVERWNISSDYMKNSSNYSTQRDAFKEKIIAAGGTEFAVSSYFSSCESGERYVTKAQCYGSGVCGTEIKTSFFPARAIAKFPKP